MTYSGAAKPVIPVISGTVSIPRSSGSTKDWQGQWDTEVLRVVQDDLGLTVVDGKLCAVYEEGGVE